jgi:PTH1 family peptidyl-tRNA hydrolase
MESKIQMIVGLGNPGPAYEASRHNAGAWFVQALAAKHSVPLRSEKRFRSLSGTYTTSFGKILFLIPQTYMNLSGEAVQSAAHYLHVPPQNILVAHDELDLPSGRMQLKLGGGHAGHNGLKDIIQKLGTKDFWRLRLGIDHPRQLNSEQNVADYVLTKPSLPQKQAIDNAIAHAMSIEDLFYAGTFDKAIAQCNGFS